MGTPLLDACPFGLGWRATATTLFFEKLGVHLPRHEAKHRTDYKREVIEWNLAEPLGAGKGRSTRKGGRQKTQKRQDITSYTVEVAARCGEARAIYDGEKVASFELETGSFALVPGVWLGEIPKQDFLCVPFDPRKHGDREIDVSLGICEGGLWEHMFEIRNCSQVSMQVEPGFPLSIIGELEPGEL